MSDKLYTEILEKCYEEALVESAQVEDNTTLPIKVREQIDLLASKAENNKALVTVLVTLVTYKIYDHQQDIRKHQAQIPGGFSGRTIDTQFITPFMKSVNFPSMSESGWLTRSLEQAHPYDLNYPGKITPKSLKDAFLGIVNSVQVEDISAKQVLLYLFRTLIKRREQLDIQLANPSGLFIQDIIALLRKHFEYNYHCKGGARLPTLAIYASYQCMMTQVARYKNKVLCPLESHTSADVQSGRIGDIDINHPDGKAFEGVEIKHKICITRQLIKDAYEKFKIYHTNRYYLLTTAIMDNADWQGINEEIQRIEKIHGCQVIVNGVYSSLRYYLRLLQNPSDFVNNYVQLLLEDETIKFEHKKVWNKIISDGDFSK